MSPEAKSPSPRGEDLRRLTSLLSRFARPYWPWFSLLLLLNGLLAVLSLLPPVVMAPILDILLDRLTPNANDPGPLTALSLNNLGRHVLTWLGLAAGGDKFRLILILALIYLGVGTLKNVVHFGVYLTALYIRVLTARAMQLALFRHILGLPLGFFTRQRAGELHSRLDTDTAATTFGFEGIVGNLLICPIMITAYAVVLVKTSPLLALAAVGGAGLHYALSKGLQAPIRAYVKDQFDVRADLRAWLQEAITGIRTVKSFGAEEREYARLAENVGRLNQLSLKLGIYKNIESPIRGIVDRAAQVGVMLLGAWQLLHGDLTAQGFFLFLYIIQAIMEPINNLGGTLVIIQNVLAASERVNELFAARSNLPDGPEPVAEFRDCLKLERVSFAYEAAPVLREIDLEIRQGQVVALVGPSGAGKSTLFDLVMRFYDPNSGRLTLDGRDLRELKQQDYRRLFGVVAQDPLLFNATVRENIRYGRPEATDEEIELAARTANAEEFIRELPQGFDTLVGDRGIRLSGGQRQRVAIARAVVAKPPLLLLDEATSALDSESEKLVQAAIDRVIVGSTALIIAHRLSTVRHADRIVVLDEGRLIDSGRHEELLARCELYQRLCRLQFGDQQV